MIWFTDVLAMCTGVLCTGLLIQMAITAIYLCTAILWLGFMVMACLLWDILPNRYFASDRFVGAGV